MAFVDVKTKNRENEVNTLCLKDNKGKGLMFGKCLQ